MRTAPAMIRYSQIQGWFTWKLLYDFMVENAKARAHFVEIGAWKGRSTAYLAQAIKKSGKRICLDVVDTWEGDANEAQQNSWLKRMKTPLYDQFLTNMRRAGVSNLVNPIRTSSLRAAGGYPNRSLDFVFLDADHAYKAVKRDLAAWYPKLKKGAMLAGHDYSANWPGVVEAVNEFASQHRLRLGRHLDCWVLIME